MSIDIEKLESQAGTLIALIKDVSGVLESATPVSDLSGGLQRAVSRNAARIAVQAQKVFNRGKPEEVIIAGTALALAWVGAKTIDVAKNEYSKAKAREKLLGLYKQLVSKQNLIIDKQEKLVQSLNTAIGKLEGDLSSAKAELSSIQKMLAECGALMQRIQKFRGTVES